MLTTRRHPGGLKFDVDLQKSVRRVGLEHRFRPLFGAADRHKTPMAIQIWANILPGVWFTPLKIPQEWNTQATRAG